MPNPKTSKKTVKAPAVEAVAATPPTVFARSTARHTAPENIEPSLIRANPRNPRRRFPQAKIEALLESINAVGMLVPLTVYEEPGDDGAQYTLLDGERRLRAAILGNWETVPAWVA
jgi:ParB family chromosome partitioning protein